MEAALILRLLLIKEKERKKQAAGIDPKPTHSQRRDDMPACSMTREATTRGGALWKCKGWRILVRHEGLERKGVTIA